MLVAALLAVTSGVATASFSQSPESEAALADRIVAVVDEDPILQTDMARAVSLGFAPRIEDEDAIDYERRVLDGLIDRKLRFHEVDRFGIRQAPFAEVDEQYAAIAARYSSKASFEAALGELGLGPAQLREILARQLMVLSFIEERLGPRVFVSLSDIREYHQNTLGPEMRRRGEPVPEISEVREQIRDVLREERLNHEIETWTRDLRLQADVLDFLEEEPRQLPPLVE